MKWSLFMGDVFRMILGLPKAKGKSKTEHYKIKPKMVTPDLVRMDYKSFRASKQVQAQAVAAKNSVKAVS